MDEGGSMKAAAEEDTGQAMMNTPGKETEHARPMTPGSGGHEGHDDKGHPPMEHGSVRKVVDPVCGMSITPDEHLSYTFNGKKYYFCSAADMQEFRDNPTAFVAE